MVGTYEKIEDGFVNTFLRRDGESTEEAKQRVKQFDSTHRDKE